MEPLKLVKNINFISKLGAHNIFRVNKKNLNL